MSESASASEAFEKPYSDAYVRYAIGLCFVVYTVNFVDRQILAILLELIKMQRLSVKP